MVGTAVMPICGHVCRCDFGGSCEVCAIWLPWSGALRESADGGRGPTSSQAPEAVDEQIDQLRHVALIEIAQRGVLGQFDDAHARIFQQDAEQFGRL